MWRGSLWAARIKRDQKIIWYQAAVLGSNCFCLHFISCPRNSEELHFLLISVIFPIRKIVLEQISAFQNRLKFMILPGSETMKGIINRESFSNPLAPPASVGARARKPKSWKCLHPGNRLRGFIQKNIFDYYAKGTLQWWAFCFVLGSLGRLRRDCSLTGRSGDYQRSGHFQVSLKSRPQATPAILPPQFWFIFGVTELRSGLRDRLHRSSHCTSCQAALSFQSKQLHNWQALSHVHNLASWFTARSLCCDWLSSSYCDICCYQVFPVFEY